jgi:hypothetical protein
MQTKNRGTKTKRLEVRSLKIQPHFRVNKESTKQVPEIKLSGNWLEKLGFIPEERASITTMTGLLIIRREE